MFERYCIIFSKLELRFLLNESWICEVIVKCLTLRSSERFNVISKAKIPNMYSFHLPNSKNVLLWWIEILMYISTFVWQNKQYKGVTFSFRKLIRKLIDFSRKKPVYFIKNKIIRVHWQDKLSGNKRRSDISLNCIFGQQLAFVQLLVKKKN